MGPTLSVSTTTVQPQTTLFGHKVDPPQVQGDLLTKSNLKPKVQSALRAAWKQLGPPEGTMSGNKNLWKRFISELEGFTHDPRSETNKRVVTTLEAMAQIDGVHGQTIENFIDAFYTLDGLETETLQLFIEESKALGRLLSNNVIKEGLATTPPVGFRLLLEMHGGEQRIFATIVDQSDSQEMSFENPMEAIIRFHESDGASEKSPSLTAQKSGETISADTLRGRLFAQQQRQKAMSLADQRKMHALRNWDIPTHVLFDQSQEDSS